VASSLAEMVKEEIESVSAKTTSNSCRVKGAKRKDPLPFVFKSVLLLLFLK
jgi:hypothetical protein